MKNFTWYQPTTPERAVALLDNKWGGAELLAGGTDLLDLQKEHIVEPEKVISIGDIPGFDQIKILAKIPPIVMIGGAAKLATIANNPVIKQYCPALAVAAAEAATPQIRNMATIGGNLCQRNRCWYFRDEHSKCLLKGGERCFAKDGQNRYHAIFTDGQACVCVNPSTIAPALMALDAKVEVLGPKGKRMVEMADFFQAPKSEADREHKLKPNEMVIAVSIATRKFLRSASYEVRHKVSYDWPLVQACVAFEITDGKAKDVKVALGHVGPVPVMATAAAKALEGKAITDETARIAGEAASEGARPLSQNAHKVKLVEVAVKRAILTAAGKKRYWEV